MADINRKAAEGVRNMGWIALRKSAVKLGMIYILAVALCLIARKLFQINSFFAIMVALTGIFAFIFLFTLMRSKEINQDVNNALKGARAEETVAKMLTSLPEEFHVVHDVLFDKWNIDHVVLGPTGIFVIETKSFNGIVQKYNKYALKHAKQAKRNAVNLNKKLQEQQSFELFVTPILVYPSATLSTDRVDGVRTTNGASLLKTITVGKPILQRVDIERILQSLKLIE